MKWVILRSGLFMQNTFAQAASIKNDSKIVLPFAADLPLAFIDVRDTSAVGRVYSSIRCLILVRECDARHATARRR
jgi:hypothetical protein